MANSKSECIRCGGLLPEHPHLTLCRNCRRQKLDEFGIALSTKGDSPDPAMTDFLDRCYMACYVAWRLGTTLAREISQDPSIGPAEILVKHGDLAARFTKNLEDLPRNQVRENPAHLDLRDILNPIERSIPHLTGWKLGKLTRDRLSLIAEELIDSGGRGVNAMSELGAEYPLNNPFEEFWTGSGKVVENTDGLADASEVASIFARILSLYSDGVSDARLRGATEVVLNNGLGTQEKLAKIDELIRIPPSASAERLGEVFGVSKQAVLKTEWWRTNRRGEKASEIGRRHQKYKDQKEDYDPDD